MDLTECETYELRESFLEAALIGDYIEAALNFKFVVEAALIGDYIGKALNLKVRLRAS